MKLINVSENVYEKVIVKKNNIIYKNEYLKDMCKSQS